MEFNDIVERLHVLRDEMAQIAALEAPTAADEQRMNSLAQAAVFTAVRIGLA